MDDNEKPSQEFLMTYGWAFLVVLGAIGALSYFNVLNFSFTNLPTGAFVSAPFTNNLKDYEWLVPFVLLGIGVFYYVNSRKKIKQF